MNTQPLILRPLSDEQQQRVVAQTQHYLQKASQLYAMKDKPVEIIFNLKGRSAGMYRVRTHRKGLFSKTEREIRYNPLIFSKYFDDNFATTIPHEVAHYVTDMIYGLKNIRPHGKEWKAVMQSFGADPSVTADYDLSGIPLKKQGLHPYRCNCRDHQLTTIRHNRVVNQGNQYYCKLCKAKLRYRQAPVTNS